MWQESVKECKGETVEDDGENEMYVVKNRRITRGNGQDGSNKEGGRSKDV